MSEELKKDEGKLIKCDLTRSEYLSPELRKKHNLPDNGLVISELRRYESDRFTDDESIFLENLWGKNSKEIINNFDLISKKFKGLLTKREIEARRETLKEVQEKTERMYKFQIITWLKKELQP